MLNFWCHVKKLLTDRRLPAQRPSLLPKEGNECLALAMQAITLAHAPSDAGIPMQEDSQRRHPMQDAGAHHSTIMPTKLTMTAAAKVQPPVAAMLEAAPVYRGMELDDGPLCWAYLPPP